MRCDCCHRKKRLLESYAAIKTDNGTMYLCAECNDLAYKVRDDANDKNKELFNEHLLMLEKRKKKATAIYLEWKERFVADLESSFEKEKEDDPK